MPDLRWYERAWAWLKKWGSWLLGGLATALLVVLTGGWWLRHQRQQLAAAKDEAAIAEARAQVKKLEAVRVEVEKRVGEKDEAIVAIDAQIREQKLKVVAAADAGEDLSDEELAARFREILGD